MKRRDQEAAPSSFSLESLGKDEDSAARGRKVVRTISLGHAWGLRNKRLVQCDMFTFPWAPSTKIVVSVAATHSASVASPPSATRLQMKSKRVHGVSSMCVQYALPRVGDGVKFAQTTDTAPPKLSFFSTVFGRGNCVSQ